MTGRSARRLAMSLALSMSLFAGAAQAAGTPEQLAVEYMAALKKDGVAAAAAYIHPEELARFKEMLMPLVRREAATGEHAMIDVLFGQGTKLAQVESMAPLHFTNALMRALAGKLEDVKFNDVEVLGTVREKEVVHVVTRVNVELSPTVKLKNVDVISTKRFGEEWKLLLTGQLEGLAAGLASQ